MRQEISTLIKTIVIIVCIGIGNSFAQELSRHQLTTAYLYNFIKNVYWPQEDDIRSFNVTLVTDDDELRRQFEAFTRDKTIRNKKIRVISQKESKYSKTHVIFIASKYTSILPDVMEQTKGLPVLVITDNYESTDQIMINFVDSPDNRLLFEINRINIIAHKLTVLPEMILLGGHEVDLVALFDEYQNRNIQLLQQQDSLQNLIGVMYDTLLIQNSLINTQRDFISNQEKNIDRIQIEIESNQEELFRLRSGIQRQELIQDSLTRNTNFKERQLKEKDRLISARSEILTQQEAQIENQNKEIEQQLQTLNEQGGVIESQHDTILYLTAVIILVVILIAVTLYGFIHIRRINANLQQEIKERERVERELIVVNDNLLEVNKELESFSYSVSHDLRAPLRAVTGFSEILFEEYFESLDPEAKRLLSIVKMNSVKMSQLIDDLLRFSRLGRGALKIEAVKMQELVLEVIEDLNQQEPIRAEVKFDQLLDINADRSMVKLVLVNLIGNALKYSAQSDNPLVTIGCSKKVETIEYFVKDNGVGFDMKYYDKLFGVFQRLHTEAEFTGNGIGLALCKRILKRHNGIIRAEGEVNNGAAFYFSIPD